MAPRRAVLAGAETAFAIVRRPSRIRPIVASVRRRLAARLVAARAVARRAGAAGVAGSVGTMMVAGRDVTATVAATAVSAVTRAIVSTGSIIASAMGTAATSTTLGVASTAETLRPGRLAPRVARRIAARLATGCRAVVAMPAGAGPAFAVRCTTTAGFASRSRAGALVAGESARPAVLLAGPARSAVPGGPARTARGGVTTACVVGSCGLPVGRAMLVGPTAVVAAGALGVSPGAFGLGLREGRTRRRAAAAQRRPGRGLDAVRPCAGRRRLLLQFQHGHAHRLLGQGGDWSMRGPVLRTVPRS